MTIDKIEPQYAYVCRNMNKDQIGMNELTARNIQENLKQLKESFFIQVIYGRDKKISILEFVEKHYYPILLGIHDSNYFVKKEREKNNSFSTKYDLDSLKDYLKRKDFDILDVFEDKDNYAKLVMTKRK
jgi:hypothetical protein